MGSAKPAEIVLSSYSEWCLSHRICWMEDTVSILCIYICVNKNKYLGICILGGLSSCLDM